MKFEKYTGILGSRVALNIYFWIMLFLLKLPDISNQQGEPRILYYGISLFLMSLVMSLTYINNLVLLPRLWFNKKRSQYLIALFLLVSGISTLYVFLLKWLVIVFPGLESIPLSILLYPIGEELSLEAMIRDVPPYFIAMLVWSLVFSLLAYFHYSQQKNRKKIKMMEDIIQKHRETELAFLRNQMNPHFLFNTLNNLYALSLKKADQAPDAILKLSTVLRYILYESNAELVSFSTEKDIMQSYIDIELLRTENSSALNFFITADRAYQIPPLIWLPLLENVFKHTRMVDQLEIDFRFAIHEGKLSVYCRNNMQEKTEKDEKRAGGIGLSNLEKRLALLYPGRHHLQIRTEDNYFIAEAQITLHS